MGRRLLFRQTRAGQGGAPFILVKFRTMTEGPEDDAARTTSVGAVLRATGIDELPQLWNVLRGEMSLVGPRPLLVDYLPLYEPGQARRHEVRPGITGLAQVETHRLNDWHEALALDVQYVDSWSMPADLRIMVRTMGTVVRRVAAHRRTTVTRSDAEPSR